MAAGRPGLRWMEVSGDWIIEFDRASVGVSAKADWYGADTFAWNSHADKIPIFVAAEYIPKCPGEAIVA